MFLLYHSDRCNTSGMVFHWCYVNDLHTTHAMVCWVTILYYVPRCCLLVMIKHVYESVCGGMCALVGVTGVIFLGRTVLWSHLGVYLTLLPH
jgi:hypothetical protein